MTYQEIKDLIADVLNRQDLTTVIPTFITLCEAGLNRELEHYKMEKRSSTTFNDRYHTVPSDFLKASRIHLSTGEPLRLVSIDEMQEMRSQSDASGKPKYYALFGSRLNDPNELSFILGPTPDLAYQAELHYFYYPESIVDAGTSWLGDNYSPVLLYGSLVEAYTYMKGEADMLNMYNTKYNEALQQLNRLGTGLERGDAYRDGQAKIKVNP